MTSTGSVSPGTGSLPYRPEFPPAAQPLSESPPSSSSKSLSSTSPEFSGSLQGSLSSDSPRDPLELTTSSLMHQSLVKEPENVRIPIRVKTWTKIAQLSDVNKANATSCNRLYFEDFEDVYQAFSSAIGSTACKLKSLDVTTCSLDADDLSQSLGCESLAPPDKLRYVNFGGCLAADFYILTQICQRNLNLRVLKAPLKMTAETEDAKSFFDAIPERLMVLDLRNRPFEMTERIVTALLKHVGLRKLALSISMNPGTLAEYPRLLIDNYLEELWLQGAAFKAEDLCKLPQMFPFLKHSDSGLL